MGTENRRIGGRLTEFLDEQGLREDAEGQAVKDLIAEQIAAAMEEKGLTKFAGAERMHTTRAQLDRLLDPGNPSVTLTALQRPAKAVCRHLTIALT